jgi:nitrogen fixation protein
MKRAAESSKGERRERIEAHRYAVEPLIHRVAQTDLFGGAIHMNPEWIRLHAWLAFTQLVPVIESRLAFGRLPRRTNVPLGAHPVLSGAPELVSLKRLAESCSPNQKRQ